MENRIDRFGIRNQFQYRAYTTAFWDIYGEGGHPIRATVSDMGPDILARILGLSEAQEGVLNIIFRIADDNGYLLIDIKDLKAMINFVLIGELLFQGRARRLGVGDALVELFPQNSLERGGFLN